MVNTKPDILIVDDERAVCDLLKDDLTEQGYLCTTALDGVQALTELEKQDFDIVLLDIKLPGMSGMEVLRRIRSNHPDTATIMITCLNSADTMVEALRLGAWEYIIKPFDLDEVSTNIGKLLKTKKHSPERRGYQTPVNLGGEEEAKPAMGELFSEMNAIARGIEAKLDILVGHSQIVAERTIDIARRLGIPEEEIQRWAVVRETLDSERRRAFDSLTKQANRSLFAESVMGITKLLLYEPDLGESQH